MARHQPGGHGPRLDSVFRGGRDLAEVPGQGSGARRRAEPRFPGLHGALWRARLAAESERARSPVPRIPAVARGEGHAPLITPKLSSRTANVSEPSLAHR